MSLRRSFPCTDYSINQTKSIYLFAVVIIAGKWQLLSSLLYENIQFVSLIIKGNLQEKLKRDEFYVVKLFNTI